MRPIERLPAVSARGLQAMQRLGDAVLWRGGAGGCTWPQAAVGEAQALHLAVVGARGGAQPCSQALGLGAHRITARSHCRLTSFESASTCPRLDLP